MVRVGTILLGGGLLIGSVIDVGSHNVGMLLVAHARLEDSAASRSLASQWFDRTSNYQLLSSDAPAQLFAMFAVAGDCISARPWGAKALMQRGGNAQLEMAAHDRFAAQICLWQLYQDTNRTQEAQSLKSDLQMFPDRILTSAVYRRSVVAALPELVRSGVWSTTLGIRVLSFALGSQDDASQVNEVLHQLAAMYPANADLAYLTVVAHTAAGRQEAADQAFREARALAPSRFRDCAAEIHGIASVPVESSNRVWRIDLSSVTQWQFNSNWVGGANFWPALFTWQHDHAVFAIGPTSLRVSGIWVQPDARRESARAAMMVPLPELPSGPLLAEFYYRTSGLGDGAASVWWERSDVILARWSLAPTNECWRRFAGRVEWTTGARPSVVLWLASLGDVWLDGLTVRQVSGKQTR